MKTARYSKKWGKLQSARNKVALFSSLNISCDTNEGESVTKPSHENQVYHPYL